MRVHLESDGFSRYIYVPYKIESKGFFKKLKSVIFHEPIAVGIDASIFRWTWCYKTEGVKWKIEILIGSLLVAIIVSRIVAERALKLLSSSQKAELIDSFSSLRAFSLIPLVVIFAIYYWALEYSKFSYKVITYIYFSALAIFIVGNFGGTQSKLQKLDLPNNYLPLFGGCF